MKMARECSALRESLAPYRPNRATRRSKQRAGSPANPSWNEVVRVASRFGVVYAGLYCLTTPQIVLALAGGGLGHRQAVADAWSKVTAIRPVREWVATNLFDTKLGAGFAGGDDRNAWVGQFCWLVAAAVATPVWSALGRNHTREAKLQAWSELVIRTCLAGQMFHYGAAKAIPLQFPMPLTKLVEPFGKFTPMNVLWAQSGFAKPYQILLGCAEIAAGLLLTLPKTSTLGAALSAVEMGQVLLLNMTFDVPVKLHSSHLLLLSLVLLAPESTRLAKAFLSTEAVPPSRRPDLFGSPHANQIATAAQVVQGLWVLHAQLRNDWTFWKKYGGGREKPALYGIWDVEDFSLDGQQRPPLTTDGHRWQRVVIDADDTLTVQRMDDSLESYVAAFDTDSKSMTLLRMTDPGWNTTLTLQRLDDDVLILDGDVDGRLIRLRLRRLDLTTFPFFSQRFQWVRENANFQ